MGSASLRSGFHSPKLIKSLCVSQQVIERCFFLLADPIQRPDKINVLSKWIGMPEPDLLWRSVRSRLAQTVLSEVYAPVGSSCNEYEDLTSTNAMSLITKKKTRVDAKRVAEIIGCSRKTVLNGGAGTAELTRIRNGSRFVRFILEEVEALAEKQERRARLQSSNGTTYAESRGQHPIVTL